MTIAAASTKGFARWSALCLGLTLAACASGPPTPEWQMNAHAASQKAQDAYLAGDTRVEQQEWDRAREALARTGRLDLLARLELLRCAGRVASLVFEPCAGFEALRQDAPAAEKAYADYLAGQLALQDMALLPTAQRNAAQAAQTDAVAPLSGIEDPLSRLVAAGVLLKTGRAIPATVSMAVETASAQGWRRPLLAWLGVQAQRALAVGDTEAAASLQRRIAIVERGGKPD
ncbi:hypothetical protein CBP36_12030 [Acidovorax carolinensis]|uniref:Lipoprotein n=1 Tax=Acidovorax carolinensis TaxID=553814 RepID=A0A240UEM4_9BURK|nr:hypothetical protein [Acidovorax carolinensis]ART54821.1 hypothetical protein CBP35_06890 [Acidovorax carolinensis]ART59470.1 hypothetical protein CBP36_12030 [Acidovorax carolinensis]